MGQLSNLLERFNRNHFLKRGLPFMILLVAGSFGLEQFSKLRYTYRRGKSIDKDTLAKMGVHEAPEEEQTLEYKAEELKKKDLDSWQNIRGPRPWEDSKAMQDEQKKHIS